MKPSSRFWRRLGLGLGLLAIAVTVGGIWGIPAVIRSQLRARYDGRVAFSGWWLNGSSAGVKTLALYEGPERSSPVWALAERVETDLTIGRLLRGRLAPERIMLVRPRITFRLGPNGEPLTRPPLKSAGGAAIVPEVIVKDGQVTIRQEPNRELVVGPVAARLQAVSGGEALHAETQDPTWGHWIANGRFEPGFGSGKIELKSVGDVIATPEKLAMIPFVPAVVWEHIDPRGAVRVAIDVTTGSSPRVVTTGEFSGTVLRLPSLGLVAEDSRGRMTVDGRVVTLSNVTGRAIGGTISANGTLDFEKTPPRFDLVLDLVGVDVAQAPRSWQLAEAGLTGRLSGKASLRVTLTKAGADLTGSEGTAVVEGGSIGGIPVKSLKLAMKAEGDELKYETGGTSAMRDFRSPLHSWERGPASPMVLLTLLTIQTPPAQTKPAPPRAGGFILPKSISTNIEFEDVDLIQVVAKLRALGIPLPFAITGRLSLKAKATIPLGALREVKDYKFHGQATLKGASIHGVDLGVVTATVDLDRGVLDLSEFQGRLVDHPAGDVSHPPPILDPIAPGAPLPSGGFRGRLHAEISPPGRLSAQFTGKDVPIGELAAPALPRPTPLSGLASFRFEATADVAHLDDPNRWTVSGNAEAARLRYRDTMLDRVSTSFSLKDGRANLPDLAASLGGHPLKAAIAIGARAPYAFNGQLDVTDWDLDAILAFVPSFPRPAPIGGHLTMSTEASGTLEPRNVAIHGQGTLRQFRTGPVEFGDVPVRWRTEADLIRMEIAQARPFGGVMSAAVDIPVKGRAPIRGAVAFKNLDVALISSAVPDKALTMSGRADGKGTFTIRPFPEGNESPIDGNLTLTAPDLTVQGVPAKGLQAAIAVHGSDLKYDLFAESLGGKIKFTGSVPLSRTPKPDGQPAEVSGSLQAVGFRLEELWGPLRVGGAVAKFHGLAAVDANLLSHRDLSVLRARGLAEIRDLRWGASYPIGGVKGVVTMSPQGWRIDTLTGDVFGGSAHGSVVADRPQKGPPSLRFDLEIDHASMRRTLAFVPELASRLDGVGTVRLAGRAAESLRADGEVLVSTAKLYGLPIYELRAPADLEYAPGGQGTLHVRRWTARFAGGRMTGDAKFGFGVDHAFQTDFQLTAIDLENLVRVLTDARRPASGKVSGKISLNGPEPGQTERYRGRIDLDLDDASVVELPVFRELDRFLGAARGGVFEHGDLHATISNRQVVIESLTLDGRLVQLHASGTVGFDTRLDLVVLVNTNQIITQTGQALASLVPGLAEAGGRRNVASARFANFLSTRLLKFRVTGTVAAPSLNLDPAVAVSEVAVGFFAGVFKLPLGLLR